jgi:aspartyl/asparaginyl beta-hydroxylase (cupin superfamily)
MERAEALRGAGRAAEAEALFGEAARLLPDHPLVMAERARRLLAGGDGLSARALYAAVVDAAPRHLPGWLGLAAALRTLGSRDEELAALERVLALEPRHPLALLQKGALLERLGRPRRAADVYRHALEVLGPGARLPPAVEAHVLHARRAVGEHAAELGAAIESRIGTPPAAAAERFARAVDQLLGRRRIYAPAPTFLWFPFLSNREFHGRELFPWLAGLEARTAAIRGELERVLAEDAADLRPYIAYREGLPLDQWRELNHSRRWSAYFLYEEGRADEAHLARCPATVAALATTPQVDIPGRGPTAFFSILDARTRIPAHTGVTNTRLTVHLPLVVPAGCGFRVGGETREWRTGTAWVFDDTLEHEAWNESDSARALLIFDVWHPELTLLERELVREAMLAVADHYESEDRAAALRAQVPA